MTTMSSEVLSELRLGLARAEVGLWIGPDARLSEAAESLATQDWLGVWADTEDSELADLIRQRAGDNRLLVEVPERLDDVLGERYSIAEIRPYFYLAGKVGVPASSNRAARRRSRDEKIEQVHRLGRGVLVLWGYDDGERLSDAIESILGLAPNPRLILVAGVSGELLESVIARLPSDAAEAALVRLRSCTPSLPELLAEVARLPTDVDVAPSLRVGQASVPLVDLLRREPPIDQDFALITERDLGQPSEQEDLEELFLRLLSGKSEPWRAFAHGLHWRRALPHGQAIESALSEVRAGTHDIVSIDVPAEPGSGITTALRLASFEAALTGVPALLHRGETALDYDRLRVFLHDLFQRPELGPRDQREPVLLVFDAPSTLVDTQDVLADLPARLARDGIHAALVRVLPVLQEEESTPRRRQAGAARCHVRSMPALSASLTTEQQADLANWVGRLSERINFHTVADSIDAIRHWSLDTNRVPLLLCLYFILRDRYSAASALGAHLVRRVASHLELARAPERDSAASDRPLTSAQVAQAIKDLSAGLGSGRHPEPSVGADDVGSILVVLSALGCLGAMIPRIVLTDVCDVHCDVAQKVLLELSRVDLSKVPNFDPGAGASSHLAPAGLYSSVESVALRHAAYGRLILEWLASDAGESDRQLLASSEGVARDVIRIARENYLSTAGSARLSEYPVEILEPILRRLKPQDQHVRFAEQIATSYLRLQKRTRRGRPGLAQFQWQNTALLRQAFEWIDDAVIRQSAPLLHGRGMTTYKSCSEFLPIAQQRQMYESAVGDFSPAIDIAREEATEHPANIITSLGLLYLGWAEREKNAGFHERWEQLDRKVEDTLRLGLAERGDNPYAAFGLSRYLVGRVRSTTSQTSAPGVDTCATVAADLSEALELLSMPPEAFFEDEWNELRVDAIGLLRGDQMLHMVKELQRSKNDLGFALEALAAMNGDIPLEPRTDAEEVRAIRDAARVLHLAEEDPRIVPSSFGNLLRYAVFSSDPDRIKTAAYTERYDRISQLVGTNHLDQPTLRFDHAMLAFQVHHFEEASESFAFLRQRKLFFEVPRERSCIFARDPSSFEPQLVHVRVVSSADLSGKGWCRVDHPIRYRDPIPFSVRSFRSRGKSIIVGASTTAYLMLNPAGPFAEPEAR